MMLRALLFSLALATPLSAQQLGPSVSGDARMGLVWERAPDWATQRENGLRMTSRARLQLEFLGETDGGLRFGARIELDTNNNQRPRSPRLAIGD